MTSTPVTLDRIDRKIIAILQADARIANVELAARVGLSPTPCSRRVKRLEDSGVITGYGARVNQAALGNGVTVLITVRLSQPTSEAISAFVEAVQAAPEITQCQLVTGNIDYLLTVRTRDVDALREWVMNELKRIPAVTETATLLVLDTVKSVE
ncbi:MAG: Lrp/AsnC family transcriptional regulator [Pseudomonadota bacterium]